MAVEATKSPPRRVRRDRRTISPATWERLRKAVIELFAAGLFHEVGIRDIASRAGVGLQTIYKYFGSKEELIFRCCQPELDRLSDEIERLDASSGPDAGNRLVAFVDAFVGFYCRHREIAEIVYLNLPLRSLVANPEFAQRRQLATLAKILRDGQEQGLIRKDLAPDLLVDLLAGAAGRYFVRLLTQRAPLDPDAEPARVRALLAPLALVPFTPEVS